MYVDSSFEDIMKFLSDTEYNNKKDRQLLSTFCEYISSNPDFKYNNSYLKHSITQFYEKLASFQNRQYMIIRFSETLASLYVSLENWHIVIDNCFVIKPDFQVKLLSDFDATSYLKQYFHLFKNHFNFYEYDVNCASLRYVNFKKDGDDHYIGIENEYLENQRVKVSGKHRDMELCSLVKNKLRLKKDKMAGA